MRRKFSQSYYDFPLWFWGILLLGILLRVASIWWNDRLLGDVNLFALTAREYAESGQLNYPMKYDFSEQTSWGASKSPQSQHPPLWSFTAGVLAKILNTNDTFWVLQLMSLFSQVLLLVIMFKISLHFGYECVLFTMSFVSLSPLLIDFAGNGSQYTLGGVFMLSAGVLFLENKRAKSLTFLLSGGLCGLAYCTHGAFILTILAVLLSTIFIGRNHLSRIACAFAALLGFTVVLIPLFIYRLEHFGSVFYNLNSIYIAGILGKLSVTSGEGGVYWLVDDKWSYADLISYLQNCLKVWSKFFVSILWELGPTGVLLGFFAFFSPKKSSLLFLLVFLACYLVPIFFWPGFKSRFLAPLLPIAMLLSYVGFVFLRNRFPRFTRQANICLWSIPIWFMVTWICSFALTGSLSRYYTFDLKHKKDYQEMKVLVSKMDKLEPSIVLGSAKSLDGGLEAFYYHKFPYVHARGFEWSLIERIQKDYEAKYFWTDEIMLTKYEPHMDQLQLVASSGKFRLFQFMNLDSS